VYRTFPFEDYPMNVPRTPRRLRWLAPAGVLALAVGLAGLPTEAADHRDGPIFPNTQANGRPDINDIYVFQAPGNVNNTVMVFTVSPFPGVLTPTTFDQTVVFDIKVDNTGDAIEDLTFRVTFGAPNSNGVQAVTLRGLPSSKFPPTGILARGNTGTNIPVRGGGLFRAAVHDDPFFFDAGQFGRFIAAAAQPPVRTPGVNFFGPNGNTLAMILEIPRTRIRSAATNPNIGVYVTTTRNGTRLDRMGRPAVNTALIPPVPRNNTSRGERRTAFNLGLPRNDRRDFRNDMLAVLTAAPFSRPRDTGPNPPLTSADGLANFLLPDLVTFNTNTAFTTNPADANGFPNGRRLRDDVIDVEFGLLTGGALTSDNVPDDNGDRITDGTRRANGTLRPAAFPYIGRPNNPPAGPNDP
jgi:hypothetical protein